jgi:hypothetical protein
MTVFMANPSTIQQQTTFNVKNHLIIGLGGTGGKVIRAFRKTVFMELRGEPLPADTKVEYLYVDSNNHEMEGQQELWKVFDRSIALDNDSLLKLRTGNVLAMFDESTRSPGISPWIGEEMVLREKVSNASGTPGANQIRRLGRFLFATNANSYTSKIIKKVEKIITGSTATVSFHVCCTLAGGTGSGSIVDAIVQIRKIYKDPETHPIFVYALITDQPQSADTGNFYANQYAALAELNALRLGHFRPFDITAEVPRRLEERETRDPFQSLILITGINQENDTATREEQEQMVAGLLYQKIVALRGAIPKQMHDAETAEDLRPTYPHELNERGYFASTMGIKRFVVPETEIREKLRFAFVLQAARQFQYNNLSESSGYLEQRRNRDLPELVTNPAHNERWCLTDNHLKLSTDFRLTGGNPWPAFTDDWNNVLEAEKSDIMGHYAKAHEQWVPLLTQCADGYFKNGFREKGVIEYYDQKRKAKEEYAKEIRDKVEADLFERWKSGEDGVEDTVLIIEALLEHLSDRERGRKLDAQIAEQKAAVATLEEEERRILKTWENVGVAARMLGKHKKVFESFVENKKSLCVCRTEVVSLQFAKELLAQVRLELLDLQNRIAECKKAISETATEIEKEITARISAAEKINYRSKVVKLLDPEAVNNTINHLTFDRSTQEGKAQEVRLRVCKELESKPRKFSVFAKEMNSYRLKLIMDEVCATTSQTAHEGLFSGASASGLQRIIGINIIERLHAQYGAVTDTLRGIIKELVISAAPYMTFDGNAAQPKVLLQDPQVPDMPKLSWTVFLPKCPSLEHPFREQVKEAFKSASESVVVEDSDHNPNEITIIAFKYWFALRFMKPLQELRRKYETSLTSAEIKKIHEIHLENHRCEVDGLSFRKGIGQLPSLFLPNIAKRGFALLILGQIMDLVSLQTHPDTGIKSLYLTERGPDGVPVTDPVDLSAGTVEKAASRLDERNYAKLRQTISGVLGRNFRHSEKRAELSSKLDVLKGQKYEQFGRNDFSKEFKEWSRGIEEAKASIDLLLG